MDWREELKQNKKELEDARLRIAGLISEYLKRAIPLDSEELRKEEIHYMSIFHKLYDKDEDSSEVTERARLSVFWRGGSV